MKESRTGGLAFGNKRGDTVRFDQVGFSYGDKKVLNHISFTMRENTMTAIVGPSGSGKTTVANLLARFWDVQEGAVYLRGTDIRRLSIEMLMNQIGMVFQRVYLLKTPFIIIS